MLRRLLPLMLTGCSLIAMRSEQPTTCTSSTVPSALDSIGGLAAGVVAMAHLAPAGISTLMGNLAPEHDTPFARDRRASYALRGGAALVVEAGFVTSAVIGARRARRCVKAKSSMTESDD